LEATRAIRAMQGPRALVPIVALTANAFVDDIQRCRDAGMNSHLGKPFRKEDLAVALVEALEGRTGFRQRHSDAIDTNAAVLDAQAIETFRQDAGEEMLQLLLNGYLSDCAAKLDRLVEIARSGGQTLEALRIAHSLKSASALAGAAALAQASARLESRLSQAKPVEERDAYEMQRLFSAYRSALAAGKFASG
jgi:two-component system sensor histidine kinase/response regulator